MNRRIIIIGTLIAVLCLWFYRENMEGEPDSAQTTIIAAPELSYKEQLISHLAQATFSIEAANNLYDSFKNNPDNVDAATGLPPSDEDMFNTMKKKINLIKE